jgi:hypothetical protein
MSNNFLQWNPNATNQENDAAWAADSQRASGAASGSIFPSPTANKLFFQLSTMVAALGQMLSSKGYAVSDANLSNLVTALGNIVTNADVPNNLVRWSDIALSGGSGLAFNSATQGYVKIPTSTGNLLIVQWGNVLMPGSGSSDNPTSFNFAIPFPHTCFVCIPATFSPSADRITFLKSVTASGGVMSNNGSQANAMYIAIGY